VERGLQATFVSYIAHAINCVFGERDLLRRLLLFLAFIIQPEFLSSYDYFPHSFRLVILGCCVKNGLGAK
jgi:hypothetical protein